MPLTTLVSDEFEPRCSRCGFYRTTHEGFPGGIKYFDPSAYSDFEMQTGRFTNDHEITSDDWKYYERICMSFS